MLFLIATARHCPRPTIEVESCPSGYSSSGNYCVPSPNAPSEEWLLSIWIQLKRTLPRLIDGQTRHSKMDRVL